MIFDEVLTILSFFLCVHWKPSRKERSNTLSRPDAFGVEQPPGLVHFNKQIKGIIRVFSKMLELFSGTRR